MSFKHIAIIASGDFRPSPGALRALNEADHLVCVDGGARHLVALGMVPDVVIGDLDSISEADLAAFELAGARTMRYPRDKDATDIELAVEYAAQSYGAELSVMGVAHGDLDHSLGNVLLLSRFTSRFTKVVLIDGDTEAIFLGPDSELNHTTQVGTTFSLVPLTPEVRNVSVTGARWPLDGATLLLGSTRSLRNTAVSEQLLVRLESGCLMVVLHLPK